METVIGNEFRDAVKHDAFLDPRAEHIIKDPARVPLLGLPIDGYFAKTSHYHGRSMEDPYGHVFTGQAIFDENHEIYTVFSIKGGDASDPSIYYSNQEVSGVRTNGLLDASTLDRCVTVSKLLREAGVLTEWPIFQARPKDFPTGEGTVGLHAFRQHLYEQHIAKQLENTAADTQHERTPVGIAGAMAQGLEDIEYGVMYRATLSGVRMAELGDLMSEGTLGIYLAQAITALQQRRPVHFAAWEEIKDLNPINEKDQIYYLFVVLPELMGENLARLHNAGCWHKYTHSGNWTLAGELVDLDSVRSTAYEEDVEELTLVNRLNEADFSADMFIRVMNDGKHDKDMAATFRAAYFAERIADLDYDDPETHLLEANFYDFRKNLAEIGEPRIIPIYDNPRILIDGVGIFSEAVAKTPTGQAMAKEQNDAVNAYMVEVAMKYVSQYFQDQGQELIPHKAAQELIALEAFRLSRVIIDVFNAAREEMDQPEVSVESVA